MRKGLRIFLLRPNNAVPRPGMARRFHGRRVPILLFLCLAIGGWVWLGCVPSPEDPTSQARFDEQARFDAASDGLPPTGFEIGSPFPLVALLPADGDSPVTIADFGGTKIVLHVFASW
jgi:hypothetical protein